MPTTKRIPLIGQHNTRGVKTYANALSTGLDQRFINCVFLPRKNPVTGMGSITVEKRPGFEQITGSATTGDAFLVTVGATANYYKATHSGGNSAIATDSASIGTLSGIAVDFTEALISSTVYVVVTSNDHTLWYHPNDATVTSVTGNRTSGSAVISGIASTTGLYSGQAITGTGIPGSTYILTVDSATQFTMTANASSGSGTSTVITVTPLAKVLSANYPTTAVGKCVFLGGFPFVMTSDGKICNGDLNTIATWQASSSIATDASPDGGLGLARYKNLIAAFGNQSIEFFENAGNPFGSPLRRLNDQTIKMGATSSKGILDFEGSLYWIAWTESGAGGVYVLDGQGPHRISSVFINQILESLPGGSIANLHLSAANVMGKKLIFLSDLTNEATVFVYDVETTLWSEWIKGGLTAGTAALGGSSGGGGIVAAGNPKNASGSVVNVDTLFFLDDGSISRIRHAAPVFADYGVPYTTTIQTSKISMDTENRKYVRRVRLVADNEASGTTTLAYSDNDYSSFTTVTPTFDMTANVKEITRLGAHRGGRSYRLTHSAAMPWRAEALDITYDVGLA